MTTTAQIEQELKAWNDEQGDYTRVQSAIVEELWEWTDGGGRTKSFEIPSGTVTLIEDHGGGEGDGEERFIVFKVGEQFFQYNGYYSSWDGTDWNDTLWQVEPYDVTVTKYRVKKD